MKIGNRLIGKDCYPLIIMDTCINHFGNFDKAVKMIENISSVGGEIIKFQCHIPSAEMLEKEAKKIIPINSTNGSSIYDIIQESSFTFEEEKELKKITESYNMIYLSTPFSKEAVDRLEEMNVCAYKIGSGEANNLPLIEYIAKKRKPIILSTGMNNLKSISESVNILEKYKIDYALLHCVSLYPTPHDKVRLDSIKQIRERFDIENVGLSDHTLDNYSCYGAIALGATIIEKHFCLDKNDIGPDISISVDKEGLKQLIEGCIAIYQAKGRRRNVLPEEQVTIDFAYASVITIKDIKKGEIFSEKNITCKRPGTGNILAKDYKNIIGEKAKKDLKKDNFLSWEDIEK